MDSIREYFLKNGIEIVDKFDEKNALEPNNIEPGDFIYSMSEFHRRALGYKNYIGNPIPNKLGKTIENYKVSLKKFKADFKYMKDSPKNIFEELIVKKGENFIGKAESCMDEVNSCGYIDLISRSMERSEICIGRPNLQNLRVSSKKVQIKGIDSCCYDMVEMDAVKFLKKLKKDNYDADFKKLAGDFCKFEELDIKSSKFILAVVSYPYDFVKMWNRYKDNKKNWKLDKYYEKLKNLVIKEDI